MSKSAYIPQVSGNGLSGDATHYIYKIKSGKFYACLLFQGVVTCASGPLTLVQCVNVPPHRHEIGSVQILFWPQDHGFEVLDKDFEKELRLVGEGAGDEKDRKCHGNNNR